MKRDAEPAPAATVVLARDGRDEAGDIEVLLVQRNTRLVFHGGHWVFPGGRIDSVELAGCGGLEYPAALQAAVRETREETAIEIRPEQLIHVAHWTTPPNLPRRFSTWFFLCPLFEAASVVVDNDEILDYRWLSPRQALAEAGAERLVLPRPTRTTLQDIAGYRNLKELAQAAQALAKAGRVRVFPRASRHYRPREMGYGQEAGPAPEQS